MAEHPVSPLAPASFPVLPPIAGLMLATGNSGIRYKGRDDTLLMSFPKGTTVAGVFTRSSMPGAPVDWCRAKLKGGKARALLVNAGIANVFTGKAGKQAVEQSAAGVAKALGCKAGEVFLASTGIIGQQLPADKLVTTAGKLAKSLSDADWAKAAACIKTTDTFAKGAFATAKIDGQKVTIAGICKGSGMIAPDMATMLAFVVTDAAIPAPVLQALLKQGNDVSFNCMTVDGDTSTSDTLLLFATGAVKHKKVERTADPRLKAFKAALNQVLTELAQLVARDGEGATKFITVEVAGAATKASARVIARAIANSPLVKTAIAGGDANWGRIVMAVGKSAEKADRDKLAVWIGDQLVARNGTVLPNYDDARANEHVRGSEVRLAVDVGVGKAKAVVWTCDLTHGYIDINADYRS